MVKTNHKREVKRMAIVYRFDVMEALKKAGYTTYSLRKKKLLSESTVQKLREGRMVALENIDAFCRLLECQPGDLLQYVPDTEP